MAQGRLKSEWERVSWLGATVLGIWRKKPVKPSDINPFEQRAKVERVWSEDEVLDFMDGK